MQLLQSQCGSSYRRAMNITSVVYSNELLVNMVNTLEGAIKSLVCRPAVVAQLNHLKIKCILLFKKKNPNTAVCFWLNLPHLPLLCIVFFVCLFWQNTQVLNVFLCLRRYLQEFCVHPHLSFVKDASSPNPHWRYSLTPHWVSTEHSYRSCQTPPQVRQRGRDECYKPLTSEPHTDTHSMPWFFRKLKLKWDNFTIILHQSRHFQLHKISFISRWRLSPRPTF